MSQRPQPISSFAVVSSICRNPSDFCHQGISFTLQVANVIGAVVPLCAWTASSRTLCNMSVTSLVAFSTTFKRPRASLAFFADIDSPLTWAVMLSAMAKPAASSAALLILLPVESLSIAC